MTTPDIDLDAIRERAVLYRANQMQHEKTHDRATALTAAAFLCAQDVPALLSALTAARAELETARAVALSNKAAHTTAFDECERLTAQLAEVRRLCDNTIWILNANDVRAVLDTAPVAAPSRVLPFSLTVSCPVCDAPSGTWCDMRAEKFLGLTHRERRLKATEGAARAVAPQPDCTCVCTVDISTNPPFIVDREADCPQHGWRADDAAPQSDAVRWPLAVSCPLPLCAGTPGVWCTAIEDNCVGHIHDERLGRAVSQGYGHNADAAAQPDERLDGALTDAELDSGVRPSDEVLRGRLAVTAPAVTAGPHCCLTAEVDGCEPCCDKCPDWQADDEAAGAGDDLATHLAEQMTDPGFAAAYRAREQETAVAGDAEWRNFTIHTDWGNEQDVYVVCRLDDVCEEVIHNPDDRLLTLGEAVDWAKEHARSLYHADPEGDGEQGTATEPPLAECQRTGTCCTTCYADFGSCCTHDSVQHEGAQ